MRKGNESAFLATVLTLTAFGCQPVTHEVVVPPHGQGGGITVRKLPPKPQAERSVTDTPRAQTAPPAQTATPAPTIPPEAVKEQERKQTRLEELEAKVRRLETENAELKAATRPTP